MTELYQITTQHGCDLYVREEDYVRFLVAAKSLIEQQRAALRSKDKKAIAACKKREAALLDFVSKYEAYRASLSSEGV